MKVLAFAASLALVSVAAFAQPYGPGPGGGPGPGAGPGKAAGPRWGSDVTPGWALMTPEERRQHQQQMRAVKDYDECRKLMEEHHARMQARAKEKGTNLPGPGPAQGRGCESLKK